MHAKRKPKGGADNAGSQKPYRLAVVTGGSSGIGEACAREAAARGATVAILDIDPAGEIVAQEIGGRFFRCDVGHDAAFSGVADKVDAALKRGDRSLDDLIKVAPLGRVIETAEIATAVDFLLSSEAAPITGVKLPVDCGWLISDGRHFYGGLRAPERSIATMISPEPDGYFPVTE